MIVYIIYDKWATLQKIEVFKTRVKAERAKKRKFWPNNWRLLQRKVK